MQESGDLWKDAFLRTFERIERIINRVDIGCSDEFAALSKEQLIRTAIDQQIVLEKIAALIDDKIPQTIKEIKFEEWKQSLATKGLIE